MGILLRKVSLQTVLKFRLRVNCAKRERALPSSLTVLHPSKRRRM
jgi:hypothetical protein